MAIDTAQKRASALGVALVSTLLIIPGGGIDQSDRQTIAHSYGGILATAPVIDTPDCYTAFEGEITASIGFEGVLTDSCGFSGTIYPYMAFQGQIGATSLGFVGLIDDSDTARQGQLTEYAAFQGKICT